MNRKFNWHRIKYVSGPFHVFIYYAHSLCSISVSAIGKSVICLSVCRLIKQMLIESGGCCASIHIQKYTCSATQRALHTDKHTPVSRYESASPITCTAPTSEVSSRRSPRPADPNPEASEAPGSRQLPEMSLHRPAGNFPSRLVSAPRTPSVGSPLQLSVRS